MKRIALILAAALAASSLVADPKMDCLIRPPKGTAKADLPVLAKVSQADAQNAALTFKGIPAGASVAESELELGSACLPGLMSQSAIVRDHRALESGRRRANRLVLTVTG